MYLPRKRLSFFLFLGLASCASIDTPLFSRTTPIEFPLEELTPEHVSSSIEQSLRRFAHEHQFQVEGACLQFIVDYDVEPNADVCFTVEGQNLLHTRRSWHANIHLSAWLERMDALQVDQKIVEGLKEAVGFVQRHKEHIDFLRLKQVERRIVEPFKLLTKEQKKLLLDANTTVLDLYPEQFDQYADTRRYRKRWILSPDMPGAPRIKVFFASQFVELGITQMIVRKNATLEALVRAVAYDYVPDQFALSNGELSVSYTKQGQWRIENLSAQSLTIHRIGGRYHEMDTLIFGINPHGDAGPIDTANVGLSALLRSLREEESPDEPESMTLAPHAVMQIDAAQTGFSRFHFPRNPYIGIKDWKQQVDFGVSLEYEVAGERRILKRVETLGVENQM